MPVQGEQITSGLLRLYSGVDVPLSQTTDVTKVTSIVKFPNVDTHWFYSDFQVAFDPCTCHYPTYLNFNITMVDAAQLEMASRTITANIELVNNNGDVHVDANFLPGINYDGETENRGMAIYYTIQQMADDYNNDLMATIQKNMLINQQNAEIKKKLAIVSVAKLVLTTGLNYFSAGAASVAATAATDAARQAPKIKDSYASNFSTVSEEDLTASIGDFYMDVYNNFEDIAPELVESVQSDGTKYLKTSKLLKKSSEYLGKGFDWLTNSTKKGLQTPLINSPMPTGTIWQASFDGKITAFSQELGPQLFNPGSFPQAANNTNTGDGTMGGLSVTAHSYPYYSNDLGLFALLETSKFFAIDSHETSENLSYNLCSNIELGGLVTGIIRYSKAC